jgi:excisionase family DNA binding protein
MAAKINPDEWITTVEAASIRKITRQAIQHLIVHDKIRYIKMGKQYFLNRNDVENFEPDKCGRPRKKQKK